MFSRAMPGCDPFRSESGRTLMPCGNYAYAAVRAASSLARKNGLLAKDASTGTAHGRHFPRSASTRQYGAIGLMITLARRPAETVRVGQDELAALLAVPESPRGLVIFAHGSGSGRLSPRNNRVADDLHDRGMATLLLDLLLPGEESDRANVFDIALLASRLFSAAEWAGSVPGLDRLPLGYFGASTGAGAAILAASGPDRRIRAIVSRGGRIDLAGTHALSRVQAPLQIIAGSRDLPVVGLSQAAAALLRCEHELIVVPGATHLFEEPGTLDEVIDHAGRWFFAHLSGAGPAERKGLA